MKKSLLFLSALGCLALPAISYADAPVAKNKKARKTTAAVAPAPHRERVICYMTSETRTGSQIPMVYREYHGRIDAAANAGVYGQTAIASTGALDVGTVLSRLDPSITTRHR